MATSEIATRVPRRTMSRALASRASNLHLGGLLLFSAGAILLMGIITAEALYPVRYSTAANEISDLGGTRPPAGLVFQPSATIFNVSMMFTGLLVSVASIVVQRATGHLAAPLALAVLGLSALLVGVFPGNTGTPHAIAAMVAFISGGVAAMLGSRIAAPPFRYVLALLGAVNLVLLASYFTLGDANPLWALGVGGAERWVAYPVILWLMGFGGYLAGRAERSGTTMDRVPSGT